MPLDLPAWLPVWCLEHLGGEPADVLFRLHQLSMVFGLRLVDGTEVVVKARADDGRAGSCVAAQSRLAERGFPCALTPVVGVGSLAVHAEALLPGGDVLHGDSADVAVRYAEVFARLMTELADVTVVPPLPNPRWVRWDHTDSGVWPAIGFLHDRDQSAVPASVVDTAGRARTRMLAAGLQEPGESALRRRVTVGGRRIAEPVEHGIQGVAAVTGWCYWVTEAQAQAQARYRYLTLADWPRTRVYLRAAQRLQGDSYGREGTLRNTLLASTYVRQEHPDLDAAVNLGQQAVAIVENRLP